MKNQIKYSFPWDGGPKKSEEYFIYIYIYIFKYVHNNAYTYIYKYARSIVARKNTIQYNYVNLTFYLINFYT
jgi:hypothetical protein